jgi:protein-disulfide isomerase
VTEPSIADSVFLSVCLYVEMRKSVCLQIPIGRELGVRATPTFLVDGSLLVGVPSTRLEREVREALERIDRSQRSR